MRRKIFLKFMIIYVISLIKVVLVIVYILVNFSANFLILILYVLHLYLFSNFRRNWCTVSCSLFLPVVVALSVRGERARVMCLLRYNG